MNDNIFIHQLRQLQYADWQAVIEGQAIVLTDDFRLEIGPAQAPNVIISLRDLNASDASTLKSQH